MCSANACKSWIFFNVSVTKESTSRETDFKKDSPDEIVVKGLNSPTGRKYCVLRRKKRYICCCSLAKLAELTENGFQVESDKLSTGDLASSLPSQDCVQEESAIINRGPKRPFLKKGSRNPMTKIPLENSTKHRYYKKSTCSKATKDNSPCIMPVSQN